MEKSSFVSPVSVWGGGGGGGGGGERVEWEDGCKLSDTTREWSEANCRPYIDEIQILLDASNNTLPYPGHCLWNIKEGELSLCKK